MNKKDIVIKSQFFPSNHPKYKFYSNDDGYKLYITSKGHPDDNKEYFDIADYMTRTSARHKSDEKNYWTNQINSKTGKEFLWKVGDGAPIWSLIISFDKSYSKEKGIIDINQTRPLVEETINAFLKNNGLNPKNMQYIAATHSDTDNIHLHIRMNEIKPEWETINSSKKEYRQQGKLKKESFTIWKHQIDNVVNKIHFKWNEVEYNQKLIRQQMKVYGEELNSNLIKLSSQTMLILNSNNTNRTAYNSLSELNKVLIDKKFNEFMTLIKLDSQKIEFDKFIKNELAITGLSGDVGVEQKIKRYNDEMKNEFIGIMKGINKTLRENERKASLESLKKINSRFNTYSQNTSKRHSSINVAKYAAGRLLSYSNNINESSKSLEKYLKELDWKYKQQEIQKGGKHV